MHKKDIDKQLYDELKEGYLAMYQLNLGIAEEHFLAEREVEINYTSEINIILSTKKAEKDGE